MAAIGAIFAAAVAAARLLRLDAAQLAQAIALSATSIGGLATAADTSVAREYHAGLAAMLGVNAALAAQRGYQCEESVWRCGAGSSKRSVASTARGGAAIATRDLGESWDICTDMAIKLVPGGHPYHAIAEAAANAAREGNVAAADIESITIIAARHDGAEWPVASGRPDRHGAQPRLFRRGGVADQTFSWQHASAAKIADPAIHRLIDRVRLDATPADPRFGKARLSTIRTRDGRTLIEHGACAEGRGALGIAWSDVDAKYRALSPASGLDRPEGRSEPAADTRISAPRRTSPHCSERWRSLEMTEPHGPLQGVKVVACSTAQAGTVPYMLMADLGAEVIKIEVPEGGDTSRGSTVLPGMPSTYFETNNRGVKSVTLNLKTEEGREILRKLVAQADIFGQNFRPGAAEKNGFGYEELRKVNPRLVYMSISGYGPKGPHARSARHRFDGAGAGWYRRSVFHAGTATAHRHCIRGRRDLCHPGVRRSARCADLCAYHWHRTES